MAIELGRMGGVPILIKLTVSTVLTDLAAAQVFAHYRILQRCLADASACGQQHTVVSIITEQALANYRSITWRYQHKCADV